MYSNRDFILSVQPTSPFAGAVVLLIFKSPLPLGAGRFGALISLSTQAAVPIQHLSHAWYLISHLSRGLDAGIMVQHLQFWGELSSRTVLETAFYVLVTLNWSSCQLKLMGTFILLKLVCRNFSKIYILFCILIQFKMFFFMWSTDIQNALLLVYWPP